MNAKAQSIQFSLMDHLTHLETVTTPAGESGRLMTKFSMRVDLSKGKHQSSDRAEFRAFVAALEKT
eukprot:15594484-Heterocapsa_arctica.AAC.1